MLNHKRVANKWICGPGGLRCDCCRKGTAKQAKRGVSRTERRKAKLAIERG